MELISKYEDTIAAIRFNDLKPDDVIVAVKYVSDNDGYGILPGKRYVITNIKKCSSYNLPDEYILHRDCITCPSGRYAIIVRHEETNAITAACSWIFTTADGRKILPAIGKEEADEQSNKAKRNAKD